MTNDARIRAALPTLRHALDDGAAVIVMSHLGRPKEGAFTIPPVLSPRSRPRSRSGSGCRFLSPEAPGSSIRPPRGSA